MQLSEDEHARLIANIAFRHGQELGSVLGDRKPFDLLFIIRVGDARTKPELRYGWDFSANNFGDASGLFRSSCGSEY